MTLILHKYVVLIAEQTAVKGGFNYEKSMVDLSTLTEDEVYKLVKEVKEIKERLERAIWDESWKKPIVETTAALHISGAEVEKELI